jgi:UDP-glucose 4-epimerase
MAKKRILVTGGAGFIGSHLVERLVQEDNHVVIVDNLSTGKVANLKGIQEHELNVEICDIMKKDDLEDVMKRHCPEIVYHLAAVLGVKRTIERPALVMKTIVIGTYNVLQAALLSDVKKVVNISSSSVYGNSPENPMNEDGIKLPESPYSISKLTAEKMMEVYMHDYGITTTSLRPFNVYGPRQDSTPYGFVISIFIKKLLADQPPEIFGDGFQTRDFCYIDDCINAIINAGESSRSDGEVFNICTENDITIYNLAKTISELIGKDIEPKFLPIREGDIKFRCGNSKKIKKVLGWKPAFTLREGLENTLNYFSKNL